MLVIKDILEAVDFYFPKNYGIILSGSQRNNREFKRESDIDVVVFDMLSSCLWTKNAEKNGFRIDFTILPVNDIENVLRDDIFEPKNVLMSMLTDGNILHDPYLILPHIVDKAKQYYDKLHFKTEITFKNYFIEFLKLKKLFSLKLNEADKIILLSDFVNIACTLETIKLTNWQLKTKHKIICLSEKSPVFLNKILELYKRGVCDDYAPIIDFIDSYRTEIRNVALQAGNEKYCLLVVDVGYKDFSFSYFVKNILPIIIADPEISSCYRYFYPSPINYRTKYKFDISLVFDIASKSRSQILLIIEQTLTGVSQKRLFFDYFLENINTEHPNGCFDDLHNHINNNIRNLIFKQDDFDQRTVFKFFLSPTFFLKSFLGIDNNEFQMINSMIAQKWLFTKKEQQNAKNHQGLIKASMQIIEKTQDFYKDNLSLIIKSLKQEINSNEFLMDESEGLYSLLKNTALRLSSSINTTGNLTLKILEATGFKNPQKIYVYRAILEEIMLMLCIGNRLKIMLLYSTSKAANEIH
ncbi:MAG: hypothetical protein JNM14_08905 [Ferruginibacter sp.]|nr:hypothetical protein [Ferruginibacter sp.]